MNTTTNTTLTSTTALASNVPLRCEFTDADVRILNRVADIVAKHGAISVERIEKLTARTRNPLTSNTIRWAFWHLDYVECGSGLWTWRE